jgi:hypothetical protein
MDADVGRLRTTEAGSFVLNEIVRQLAADFVGV